MHPFITFHIHFAVLFTFGLKYFIPALHFTHLPPSVHLPWPSLVVKKPVQIEQ